MPYHVDDQHPDCSGYAVVKDDTGEVIPGGCHVTLDDAEAHLTAVNIAEFGQRAVDLEVPAYIRDAAARGLELRAEGKGGDGLVARTIREARNMAAGQITTDKVIRANAWAARHAVDLEASQNTDPEADGWPGNGAVAHYLWGIDPTDPNPAREWFARKAEAIAADQETNMTDARSIDETIYPVAPAQAAVYQALEDIVEIHGKFDQSTGPNGAHYVAESPFASEGLVCSNCLFYEGARACEIVQGDIAPEAICKFWQIPEALVVEGDQPAPAPEMQTESLSRDNLSRIVEFRAMPSDDGLTLQGYAAVFNEWTTIDSWEGTFRERIAPGAFKRTLGQRMPVLQFDHGSHPLIGSIPLGRITSIVEDERGLKVKARLSDNWLVEPVRDAIRDGAINGMSFRFSVPANGDKVTRGADGMLERTINEIALYEVGPVVFPAYEATSVGVRSRQALDALQDPEVRSELARILATGTDVKSLATSPDPVADHSGSTATDSDQIHSEPNPRSRAQREALVALYLK